MPDSHIDDALSCLDRRRSTPARHLAEPGPDREVLLRMLASSVRVPDHGKRVPFRFIALEGDNRDALGERLARRSRERDPLVAEAVVEKDRQRFSLAPLVVTVAARLGPDEKIPEQERLLSAGNACFALLQAAQALGFGAVWLTGWPAYDPQVHDWLGLQADERVVGFIHIGTPTLEAPERDRPDPAALLSWWAPA